MPTHRRIGLAILLLLVLSGPTAAGDAPRLVGYVTVEDDGLYRLPAASLEALGVTGLDRVEVRRGGRAVPAAEHEGLVFLARDVADDHSRSATFEVWLHETPWTGGPLVLRNVIVPSVWQPLPREVAPDRVYGELASADPDLYDRPLPTWFLASIPPGQGTVIQVGPEGAKPESTQDLLVTVYVAHEGPVVLHANWGGEDLGEARAEGAAEGAVLRWSVPAAQVPGEPVALLLRDKSPPPPPRPAHDASGGRGVVWVDRLALRGPIADTPEDPRLLGWRLGSGPVTLEHDRMLAYAVFVDREGTPFVPPRTADRFDEPIPLPAGTRIFGAAQARVAQPVAAELPPDPLATAGDARHVILAVPPLVQPARVLADHRSKTGTPSAVVPVTDVYAHYGHGEAKPAAIRAYVEDLLKREGAPLDHLLLAGDATFNRTDVIAEGTIPVPMGRSMYNGATAADRLYALPLDGAAVGGPSVGRLPFREAGTMRAYVDRVKRYETTPPAHASRRMLRFVTSEGRFGPFLDRLIENVFRNVITNEISSAFDIEVTFASQTSAFLWPPPEFNDKVLQSLNDGALFFTYVGHGNARGFDNLYTGDQVHRILHVSDVPRVDVKGTPPVMFVLACTTAMFDGVGDGVGEALLKRPAGPVAYWGATRICHPAFNTLMGQGIARFMTKEGEAGVPRRLGQVLDKARDEVIEPTRRSLGDTMLRGGIQMLAKGADVERLNLEGALTYVLLGDPALKVALPAEDLGVEVQVDEGAGEVVASIKGPLPHGATMHVSLELPRNRNATDPTPVRNPTDPTSFAAIRAKHDAMNDWALVRAEVPLEGGEATVRLPLGEHEAKGLIVKAWAIAGGEVHQGATVLR